MNTVELNKEEKRQVLIYPAKVSRRILAYLADLIILLMGCLLIFQVVCIPTAYATTGYEEKTKEYARNGHLRTTILYDNDLLFYKDDKDKFDYQKNLVTTSYNYAKNLIFDDEPTYDVFSNYFIDIRKQDTSFVNSLLLKYGENFFDTNSLSQRGTYRLKSQYVDLFKPNFIEEDQLSEDGRKAYEEFNNLVFLNLYKELTADIKQNDLTSPKIEYGLESFNYYTTRIDEYDSFFQLMITTCAYISFFLSAIVFYFVIPLCTSKHQTLSEMILKIERVNKHDFNYLKRWPVALTGFINTVTSLVIVTFIPLATVGPAGVFAFSYLSVVSLVFVLFVLVQLFLLLLTKFNTTLKEIGTDSIVCDTSVIDEYYKELGYGN